MQSRRMMLLICMYFSEQMPDAVSNDGMAEKLKSIYLKEYLLVD